ncbi:MAG: hypothetical protein R3Y60_04485 [bacterium]
MDNIIALIIAVFFILFSFIGFLRKPMTCLSLFFVVYTLIVSFVPSFDNEVAILAICGVVSALSIIVVFKFDRGFTFLYGFVLTNLCFFNLITVVDAILSLTGAEELTFLTKLLNDELALSSNIIKLIASCGVGFLLFVFDKRMVETISSLFGTFMIIIFVIDIFRGGTSASIPFDTTLFSNILATFDNVVLKNFEVYTLTLTSDNYLHILLAVIIGVVISIATSIIKKDKYEFI